jgi:hypothetical protein
MKKNLQPEVIQSYIIPIVLAIVILAISQLINLVSVSNLLEACGLCAVVISGLFVGQYVAFKALRLQERDALYGILSVVSFSGSSHIPTSGVLAQGDILGMESSAHEVWVYAYDLNYENFDRGRSVFTNAVVVNLTRGVRYKYLVPDSPEIIRRAERMQEYLRRFAASAKQLEFRVASSPPLFNQFGVTLYNPDNVESISSPQTDGKDCDTVAVFFPHAKDFEAEGIQEFTPFIAVRNGKAMEIQEKFEDMLAASRILSSSLKSHKP